MQSYLTASSQQGISTGAPSTSFSSQMHAPNSQTLQQQSHLHHTHLPQHSTSSQIQHHPNSFHSRYQCLKKIGSGSFGQVFLASDMYSNEKVAVKFESKQCRFPQLVREGEIMRDLAGDFQNSASSSHQLVNVGVPRLRFLGETMNHRCLVQDLLGDSIEHLFQQQQCYFSMKTVLLLADQILSRIEYLHYKGYVHRDIKPENFLMGRHGTNQALCVYIIDFGLSKQYRDPRTHRHIPFKINKSLTGTARYASINNHKGMEQSRRDDLESVGYMLIYFLRRGLLPWQNLSAKTKEEKYARICEKKQGTPLRDLCNGFPDEFRIFVEYARSLQFTDTPDYSYMRTLFQNLFVRLEYSRDFLFDWCTNMQSSY